MKPTATRATEAPLLLRGREPRGGPFAEACRRPSEASSNSLTRDWSVVAATIARRSGRRSSVLDALFVEEADRDLRPRRVFGSATARARAARGPFRLLDYRCAGPNLMRGVIVTSIRL